MRATKFVLPVGRYREERLFEFDERVLHASARVDALGGRKNRWNRTVVHAHRQRPDRLLGQLSHEHG